MNPIDERPRKRKGKKRKNQNQTEQEDFSLVQQQTVNELNQQLMFDQQSEEIPIPKKRAGTTGQPGSRKNYIKMNMNPHRMK